MEPKTIKLTQPISFGSELISELTIRLPKAKDLRKLPSKPETGDILDLAGRLCGQPPSMIDELCIEDTTELLEVVGNFMAPGPKTGEKA